MSLRNLLGLVGVGALSVAACGGEQFSSDGSGGSGGSSGSAASGGSAGSGASGAGGSGASSGSGGGPGGSTSGGAAGSASGGNAGSSSGGDAGSSSGGSAGTSGQCSPAPGGEVWVDASAVPGGNGSEGCPFRTISDGLSALGGVMGGTVHVKAGPTYDGGFSVPNGTALIGSDNTTRIEGNTDCGDGVSCSVVLEQGGRLENFTIVPETAGDGVYLRSGGNPILKQVRVRGGRVGIVVEGAAELQDGVEATDTSVSGLDAVAERPDLLRFQDGQYKFTGALGIGIRVGDHATLDMSAMSGGRVVDLTGRMVGMRFDKRVFDPAGNAPVSLIRNVKFGQNVTSLSVDSNVRVQVRASFFLGASRPAVRLTAPSFADLGGEVDPGGNFFEHSGGDPNGPAFIMLCEQGATNIPKVDASGNQFSSCPSLTYKSLPGSCPDTSSEADIVAYFGQVTPPVNAAVHAACP